MLTLACRFLLFAAIGLFLWASVLFVVSDNASPVREALAIEEPERNIGELSVGAHTVTFRVRNTTQLPQRIVGMAEG